MVKEDQCWIIENGTRVTAAEILSFSGNLCLIRLASGKALRVPRHRLFDSKEAAEQTLPQKAPARSHRTPYDFM